MSAAFAASIRGVRYLRLPDTTGRPVCGTMPELIGKHSTPRSKDAAQLIGFYIKEGTRSNASVLWVTCLVYDFDNAVAGRDCTIEQVLALLDARAAEYTLHTTYSHTPERHKFRVILPLDDVLAPEFFVQAWTHVAQLFGFADDVDSCGKKISQAYYLPSCPAEMRQYARLIHCYKGVKHGA